MMISFYSFFTSSSYFSGSLVACPLSFYSHQTQIHTLDIHLSFKVILREDNLPSLILHHRHLARSLSFFHLSLKLISSLKKRSFDQQGQAILVIEITLLMYLHAMFEILRKEKSSGLPAMTQLDLIYDSEPAAAWDCADLPVSTIVS